jgi:hypothetical protein
MDIKQFLTHPIPYIFFFVIPALLLWYLSKTTEDRIIKWIDRIILKIIRSERIASIIKRITRHPFIVISILYAIILIVIYCAINGYFIKASNYVIGIIYPPTSTPAPNPTPTYTETLNPSLTPTHTPTLTITLTPTPARISELPSCIFTGISLPCKYKTIGGEWPWKISINAYGDPGYTGWIVELYRNSFGDIPAFVEGQTIIIPDNKMERNESYYQYYFGILEFPIHKCEGDIPTKPCWYVIQTETNYYQLSGKYKIPTNTNCIIHANTTEFGNTEDKLIPKTLKLGVIIVLPVCGGS